MCVLFVPLCEIILLGEIILFPVIIIFGDMISYIYV